MIRRRDGAAGPTRQPRSYRLRSDPDNRCLPGHPRTRHYGYQRHAMSGLVIAVVLTALVFDFTNGFHDAAIAMATSIATGALRPRVAVALAGVLTLVGAFLSVQVALTISNGLVDEAQITPEVIFAGL